jgi:hypothetical protein
MPRFLLAASLIAALALAACSPAPTPSAAPSAAQASPATPASPSPSPIASPPTATPVPTVTPAPRTPEPTPVAFTAKEQYLVDGVRRGATDCRPVRTDDLPDRAAAGIECSSPDRAVSRVGFYLFNTEADMLDVYAARMTVEGVLMNSGTCSTGEAEGAYMPGPEENPYRNGCYVNAEGFANYRATLPGNVYVGILGRTANMLALETFAWAGNEDIPGAPTLWSQPS